MSPANISRQYLESSVLSATPVEVIRMIFDVAIESVNSAIAHLKSGDAMARAKAVSRAQEAIEELSISLDRSSGAAFVTQLSDLYVYARNQVTRGHIQQSEAAFSNALSILKSLAETWAEVAASAGPQQTQAEPAETRRGSNARGYAGAYAEEEGSRSWSG